MINKALITLFLLLIFSSLSAQKFNVLSKQEKTDLKLLAEEYVKEFGDNLQDIPRIKNKFIRKERVKQFVKNFLDTAKVEVAINKRVLKKYNAKSYFGKVLIEYGRNIDVIDIQILSFEIGNIKPVDGKPGMYYLEYTVVQQFRKYDKYKRTAEGLKYVKYGDITIKEGRFYIKKVYTTAGARWRLYFGSIKVVDYKRL